MISALEVSEVRKDKLRPYTGRSNRGRNLLIAAVVLVLISSFLFYTYRTDEDFQRAVQSLLTVFRPGARPDPSPEPPPLIPSSGTPEGGGEPPPAEGAEQPAPPSGAEGRLLYCSPAQLADPDAAVRWVRESGYDGLLVDLKQTGGSIAYRSQLQNDAALQAVSPEAYDLAALAALCRAQGLSLVGRLSTFADHIAPGHQRGSAVTVASGVAFLDGNYQRSLDPYKAPALDYLALLVEEAAGMGVSDILLTDLQFPHYGKLSLISYGGERSKPDQLLYCISLLTERAAIGGARVSVGLPLRAFTDSAYAEAAGQTFAQQLTCALAVRLQSSDPLAQVLAGERPMEASLEPLMLLLDSFADAPLTLSLTADPAFAQTVFEASGAKRLLLSIPQ
ncbi:MAG: hypothetical protein GXX99_02885 [Clostridiales bacterium]|nr:hypothetical protein [Clostridiales bacterium]